MKNLRRTINLFGPPLIAAVLLCLHSLIVVLWEGHSLSWKEGAAWFLYTIFGAYILGLVPACLHTLVMERVYVRWPGNTHRASICSGLSGIVAGLSLALIAGAMGGLAAFLFFYLALVGGATGLILAWIVHRLARPREDISI